jgi:hypothetical protein
MERFVSAAFTTTKESGAAGAACSVTDAKSAFALRGRLLETAELQHVREVTAALDREQHRERRRPGELADRAAGLRVRLSCQRQREHAWTDARPPPARLAWE